MVNITEKDYFLEKHLVYKNGNTMVYKIPSHVFIDTNRDKLPDHLESISTEITQPDRGNQYVTIVLKPQ